MAKPFIFNDESKVNSYGFVVRNAGGKFDRFKENPVMLYDHDTGKLIGRWENLRVEGTRLVAEPVFDTEDTDAKVYEGKVERGFLKGCSMGISIHNAEIINVPGKGLVKAVTEWELMEGTLTPVPSNGNSLLLYSEKGELLKSRADVQLSIDKFINKPEKMDKISISKDAAKLLNLSSHELENGNELSAAIVELSGRAEKAEKDLKTFITARATNLVDTAIKEGRLSADKKDSFVKLAESDFKQAEDLISAMPGKQTLSGKVREMNGTKGEAGRDDWNYLKWAREDPKGLAKMRSEEPERFEALRASYSK
ncbi:MAG: HK97 family phage prohead protease [Bacteroidales bacterium]